MSCVRVRNSYEKKNASDNERKREHDNDNDNDRESKSKIIIDHENLKF